MAYGPVHDLVVERFKPYRALEHEVLDLVELAVTPDTPRRSVRILDIGCGPGTFTAMLAAAGFSVIGIDRYTPLLDVARETRRSRGLNNISFSRLDLKAFGDGEFDQVVSIHSLYAHPDPDGTLTHAARVLKPGGHAVFVNHVSRFALRRTFRAAVRRRGWLYALGTLRWLVPNRLFEILRQPFGPHYWDEAQLAAHFADAGFTVLDLRRTFLDGGSALVWARKSFDGHGPSGSKDPRA